MEILIRKRMWFKARDLIDKALKIRHNDHWFLARKSLIFHSQGNHKKALVIARKAYELAPKCPLVLWEYAGVLQILGKHRESMRIYNLLVRKGVNRTAFGVCGEGKTWARGLIADCHYRMAISLLALGIKKKAKNEIQKYIATRKNNCASIYSIEGARRILTPCPSRK